MRDYIIYARELCLLLEILPIIKLLINTDGKTL
jgi:hypothetical protein